MRLVGNGSALGDVGIALTFGVLLIHVSLCLNPE
jgi:hypothetical protein